MHRLICAFVVRMWHKQVFLMTWLDCSCYSSSFVYCVYSRKSIFLEPANEVMVLFVLRKLILQTRMCSRPVGMDVWYLVRPFVYFHTSCVRTANGSGETARMHRLAWAFAGRLCDEYQNLMSWLPECCPSVVSVSFNWAELFENSIEYCPDIKSNVVKLFIVFVCFFT